MRLLFVFFLILFLSGCGQKKYQEINQSLLLELHNQERDQHGIDPLHIDDTLAEYATNHASWMAKKNTLQHSNISNLLGKYRTVGENIAWNQNDENAVVIAWMNSKPHRANILNAKFKLIGFGMSRNSRGQPYWCAVFGS